MSFFEDVEGSIEVFHQEKICGWVWRPQNALEKVTVDIVLDGKVIASTTADSYRQDLEIAGKGDGFCSFSIAFDPPLPDDAVAEVHAGGMKLHAARSLDQSAPAAPVSETGPALIEGNVDYIRPDGAMGWVWYPERPEARLVVEAYLNGHMFAEATADLFRSDLLEAGKGNGACAFNLIFDPPIPEEDLPEIRVREPEARRIFGRTFWNHPQDIKPLSLPFHNRMDDDQIAEFYLDRFDTKCIAGWAWYPKKPGLAVLIELVRGKQVIATTWAKTLREDLRDAGYGTGRYGFSLGLDDLGDLQTMRLRVGGAVELPSLFLQGQTAEQLEATPMVGPLPIEGGLDAVTRTSASGWVWCPSQPDLVLAVEARIGERIIGRVIADQFREDLVFWGKGSGYCGFRMTYYDLLLGDEAPEFHVHPAQDVILGATQALPALSKVERSRLHKMGADDLIADHQRFTQPGPEFEEFDPDILTRLDATTIPVRPIVFAYYLPQFHAIPVNDHFWGKGFTEWRQIARAMPRFPGHYQPRIPRDLGFYDLNDQTVLPRQAELAKAAGINAFCYYYYWFNGKRVLERPLDAHIASDVDMPFMIMWANENWTKTWDGFESDVLLRQDYRQEDEDALLADLARHFRDPRYVRLNGRPLFFLYNPKHLPDASDMIARWREKLRTIHAVDPLIFMAQAFTTTDPNPFGLDGAIEFPPHKLATPHPGRVMPDAYSKDFQGRVIAYEDFADTSLGEPLPDFPLIKTIVPSWDNDARRPGRGLTLEGIAPGKYQAWLEALILQAIDNPIEGVPLVAVNAWNEWAEAAYLEPDVYYGSAFLNSTARGLVSTINGYVAPHLREKLPGVTVVMPCFNHARFLPERIGSILSQRLPPAEIVFLDDASTDDSVAVARELLKDSPIPWRIEVNETNSGNVFRQWLKGISLAKHELIWIAETDDSADCAFLANILPAFRDESVYGAYGHIRCIDPEGEQRDDLDSYYNGLEVHSWDQSSVTPAAQSFAHDFAVRNIVPNASGFVFRKPVLTSREEDRLLQYRFAGDWYFYALLLRGGSLAYCRRAKSWFRVNPQSASRSAFMTDRHLAEHRMILEDLACEYGLSERALADHARQLSNLISGQTAKDLQHSLAPNDVGKRPRRICIAAHSFAVGGGEVVPLELANKLRRLGHHVTYLVMERVESGAASIRDRLRKDIPVVYWENICDDVPGFIIRYGIDVLNSHNVGVDYHLYRRAIQLPCAWVVSLHGGYETVAHLLNSQFISYLQNGVDTWLSLARKNQEVLLESGLEGADFRESFNAVADVAVDWIDRDAFRAEQGLPADAFALMICSRAIEEKGWRVAIDVCQRLNASQSRPVHLFMIGDGPALEGLQGEFGADRHLHFLGHIEAPMRYFRCFDMAVFPSTYVGETFPLFLVECLTAGLPIIASDIGEIPRIMGRDAPPAGALVSYQQPAAAMAVEITRLIESYLESPDALDVARHNATLGSERFAMSRLADFYLSVFDEKIAARTVASEPSQHNEEDFVHAK